MDNTNPPYDWLRMQRVRHMPRSVSQVAVYLESLGGCNYRYFLARVVQAWDRPAAWLPMGLAVHEAAEAWEKSGRTMPEHEVMAKYHLSYRMHTERLLKLTPNAKVWFASGRYEGPEDITRREDIGAQQVGRYLDYYRNQRPGQVIWMTPSGEPAIELGFSVMFGSVHVRGFIDQIIQEFEHDNLTLRDIKTGQSPGNSFQLGTYRYAVLQKYDVDILSGDYWMGVKGKPTKPYSLDAMSLDQVTDLYETMDAGVKAESFDPSPSPEKCRRCGVATACQYAM
jgi:putative RecB family exonuclease